MKTAIKWTVIIVVVSLIIYEFNWMLLKDMVFMSMPTITSILQSLLMIIVVLFLLTFSLNIIIQDYE